MIAAYLGRKPTAKTSHEFIIVTAKDNPYDDEAVQSLVDRLMADDKYISIARDFNDNIYQHLDAYKGVASGSA